MTANYDVILAPVITEKATRMTESNQAVFRVALDATKPAIAKAVADLFKVKVKAVNTVVVKGKRKAARGRAYARTWSSAAMAQRLAELYAQVCATPRAQRVAAQVEAS